MPPPETEEERRRRLQEELRKSWRESFRRDLEQRASQSELQQVVDSELGTPLVPITIGGDPVTTSPQVTAPAAPRETTPHETEEERRRRLQEELRKSWRESFGKDLISRGLAPRPDRRPFGLFRSPYQGPTIFDALAAAGQIVGPHVVTPIANIVQRRFGLSDSPGEFARTDPVTGKILGQIASGEVNPLEGIHRISERFEQRPLGEQLALGIADPINLIPPVALTRAARLGRSGLTAARAAIPEAHTAARQAALRTSGITARQEARQAAAESVRQLERSLPPGSKTTIDIEAGQPSNIERLLTRLLGQEQVPQTGLVHVPSPGLPPVRPTQNMLFPTVEPPATTRPIALGPSTERAMYPEGLREGSGAESPSTLIRRSVGVDDPDNLRALASARTAARGAEAKIALARRNLADSAEALSSLETRIKDAEKTWREPGVSTPARRGSGLTPDEITELDRLKGRLALDESALADPRPYSATVAGELSRPGSPGYRPPPARTAAQRVDDIADANDTVKVARAEVADAQAGVRDGLLDPDDLTSAKSALIDARAELRQAKKPAGHTTKEKAYIAAADKLDAEYLKSLRASIQRTKGEIASLEARQAPPTAARVPGQTPDLPPEELARWFQADEILETAEADLALARGAFRRDEALLADAEATAAGRQASVGLRRADLQSGRPRQGPLPEDEIQLEGQFTPISPRGPGLDLPNLPSASPVSPAARAGGIGARRQPSSAPVEPPLDIPPTSSQAPPPGTPPGKPPPVEPPTAPAIRPDVPAPHEILSDLRPVDEMMQVEFQPDNLRRIANLPGIRRLQGMFNRAAVADLPEDRYIVGRHILKFEGQQKALGAFQRLGALGSQESVFGKVDDTGLLASGANKGRALNDIRSNPDRFNLSPQQREWVDTADDLERAKLDLLERNDIPISKLSFDEGGQYAGRRVFAKVDSDGNLLDTTVFPGPGRPGAKLGAEKTRGYATQEEAIKDGFRYLSEEDALYHNLQGAYNRVADKHMADWLLDNVPTRTTATPEGLKFGVVGAQRQMEKAVALRGAVNRAVRGEKVPENTIRSIERFFPEDARTLRELRDDVQIIRSTPGQPSSVGRPRINVLKDRANAQTASAAADLDVAKRRLSQAKKRAQEGNFEFDRVDVPAFGGRFFEFETARKLNREFSQGQPWAPLVNLNKAGAVYRVLKLGGDASQMGIQLLYTAGSNPRAYAKAGRGYLKALFDPDYHAKLLAQPENARVIQEMPGLILSANGTEFTEAASRGGLLTKLGPAHKYFFGPTARGFETALDTAGLEMAKGMRHLAKTPEDLAGLAAFINEFRGLASSSRLGVSPTVRQLETTALLAPRYNRAIAALLTDSIAGLVGGVGRTIGVAGGTTPLRQKLARDGMMKGVGALLGVATAIGIARGESVEQLSRHLKPANSGFFLWDVAGQKVGPGTKVRTVAKLVGDTVDEPTSFGTLGMQNPGLRFVRGNFGPVPSIGMDVLKGSNYMGEPIMSDKWSLPENLEGLAKYGLENILPIWVESMALEGGAPLGRGLRGAAEFLGARAYPFGALDILKESSQEIFGKDYDKLETFEKGLLRELKRPSLQPLQEQSANQDRQLSIYFQDLDRIEKDRINELQALVKRGNASYLDYQRVDAEARGARREAGVDIEFDDRDPDDPVNQYYAILMDPQYRIEGSRQIDPRKRGLMEARLRRFKNNKVVLRNTNTRPIPFALLQVIGAKAKVEFIKSQAEREKFLNAQGKPDLARQLRRIMFVQE